MSQWRGRSFLPHHIVSRPRLPTYLQRERAARLQVTVGMRCRWAGTVPRYLHMLQTRRHGREGTKQVSDGPLEPLFPIQTPHVLHPPNIGFNRMPSFISSASNQQYQQPIHHLSCQRSPVPADPERCVCVRAGRQHDDSNTLTDNDFAGAV